MTIRFEMRNYLKAEIFFALILISLLVSPISSAQQQVPQKEVSGLFGIDSQIGNARKNFMIPHSAEQVAPNANQITVRQTTIPISGITFPCMPSPPLPINCDVFKGSQSDLNTLRQTVSVLWELRGRTKSELESKAPQNCKGKEWTYYMKVLAALGDGTL